METLYTVVFLGLYVGSIIYCYKIAKKLQANIYIAVIVGILIPFGSILIYSHLSTRHNNGTAPEGGQVVKYALLVFVVLLILFAVFAN